MARTAAALTRIGILLPIAAIVTFALFVLMQVLIQIEPGPPPQASERPRVVIAEYIPEHTPEPAPPMSNPETVLPPPAMPISTAGPADNPGDAGGEPYLPSGEEFAAGIETASIAFTSVPRSTIRVAPVYPARMASRGQEGACTVTYDILGSGETANVRVARCDRGFERATIEAVRGWKYTPSPHLAPGEIAFEGKSAQLDYRLDGG